jgi:gliding motility-associated-like protein
VSRIIRDGSDNMYVAGTFSGSATIGATTLTSSGNTDICLTKYSPAGAVIWTKRFGGAGYDYISELDIRNGDLYLSGTFDNTTEFQGNLLPAIGTMDAFLARIDNNGNLVWVRQAGYANTLLFQSGLTFDNSNNVYFSGSFGTGATFGSVSVTTPAGQNRTGYIAKYDPNGNVLWVKTLGGSGNAEPTSISCYNDKLFITGYFTQVMTLDAINLNAGASTFAGDLFLARFNTAGVFQWAQKFGGSQSDAGLDVLADNDGSVLLCGMYTGSVNFGGQTLSTGSINYGHAFLAKYTDTGTMTWAVDGGGAANVNACATQLCVDASHNSYVTGWFAGSGASFGSQNINALGAMDIYVAKYSSAGNTEWIKRGGGTWTGDSESGYGICVLQDERVFMTGYMTYDGLFDCIAVPDDALGFEQLYGEIRAVPELPLLANDTILCPGQQLVLTPAASSLQYLWQDGSTDSVFTATQPGTYWVQVTTVGCPRSDTIVLAPGPSTPFTFATDSDTTICSSASLTLDVSGYNYEQLAWHDGSADSVRTFTASGTYWVDVTNTCGLIFSDTVVLTVQPDPQPFLGNDTVLCDGASLALTASAAGTPLWSDGSSAGTLVVDLPGTYWVEVTQNGCIGADTILIDTASLAVPFIGNDTVACSGVQLTLSPGTAGGAFLWSDNSVGQTLQVQQPGTYWVRVTNVCGTAADTTTIALSPLAGFSLGNDTTLCENDTLLIGTVVPNAVYLWQDNSTDSLFEVAQAGQYNISVTLDQCVVQDAVIVNYTLIPSVDLGVDTTLCATAPLVLNATSLSATAYLWSNNSTGSTLSAAPGGTYWVHVSNACGFDDDTISIALSALAGYSLGNDTTLCENDTLLIGTVVPNAVYLWQDNSTDSLFEVAQAGQYNVSVTLDQCVIQDAIIVNYTIIPSVDLGVDTTLCATAPLVLNATSPSATAYLWSDNSTGSTLSAAPGGTYWVHVSNACGFDDDTISIALSALAGYSLGNDTTLCENDTLLIGTVVPNAVYLWQDNSADSLFEVTQAGQYNVSVTLDQCQVLDTIIVNYTLIPVTDLGSDTTLCSAAPLVLNAASPSATAYLWPDNSTGSTLSAAPGGTYWVHVSNACGFDDDTISIALSALTGFSLGNDTMLCENDTLLIGTVVPNAAYLWQDNSIDSLFEVTQAGQYDVSVTLDQCQVLDTVTISYTLIPVIDLGSDTTLCSTAPLVLNAASPSATAYLWSDNSTGSTLSAAPGGTYWVHVSNACGFDDDTIALTLSPLAGFWLGSDTTLCENDSLLIGTVVPNAVYLWQDNSADSLFEVTQAGQYSVSVTLDQCQVLDTIIVNYTLIPVVSLGGDTTMCSGSPLVLTASSASATNYTWSDNSTGPVFSATAGGTYWIVASNACGSGSDTVTVTEVVVPDVQWTDDTTLCNGDTLILNAFTTGASYLWQNGSVEPDFNVSGQGVYWVNVSVGNCSQSDTITVDFQDIPAATLSEDTLLCIGETLVLDVAQTGMQYEWQDGSAEPFFRTGQGGTYWVTITNGCASVTDSIEAVFEDCSCTLYFPNTFTPQNDGVNDNFGPVHDCPVADYTLLVFDRWGTIVFQAHDPADLWDGTYQGNTVPDGIYSYECTHITNGIWKRFNGHVTVLR